MSDDKENIFNSENEYFQREYNEWLICEHTNLQITGRTKNIDTNGGFSESTNFYCLGCGAEKTVTNSSEYWYVCSKIVYVKQPH